MVQWDSFVKTYDVRGLVASQLTEPVVRALGFGFASELELAGKKFAIGYDMRESSPRLARAFIAGASQAGARALELGLCSTDMTYFVSGQLELPAVMLTASHNPASYNGLKLSRAGAQGISLDSGLAAIRDRAADYLQTTPAIETAAAFETGASSTRVDIARDYAEYLRSLVTPRGRRLRVVVDAANGMAGHTVGLVLGADAGLDPLNLEIIPLYFELDGSFPNHEANPLDEKNLVDLQHAVLAHQADLGLAFDGDADRCFFIDELGSAVSPSAVAAIISRREIERVTAAGEAQVRVIHNLLTSKFVAEIIAEVGAEPIETRVGHSLIKSKMAETAAVFGGEHSGHYYFRDFWGADNGMLAALHILAELAEHGLKLSELSSANNPYFQSGEINSTVADAAAATARLKTLFAAAESKSLDGLTLSGEVDASWWWLNVRPSNTEPLLRLNVESNSRELMAELRDRALAEIRRP
jgi:phosphomannomutase